ncbi:multi-sensor signal transduction histidine kinase [Catenovulum agarivorans DS-2]|uniref:histidine kinase n=1 Tax=Catenovulum agarivorans DS-2 TaxID=1328313 RepID=W7QPF8_9ALTE|nr:sensor histidine kinase [Catenovulum agarivorans]EWH10872.1 multi-sensor signal transduction histidine kinase [Catenovulum agarivorans DS-2]
MKNLKPIFASKSANWWLIFSVVLFTIVLNLTLAFNITNKLSKTQVSLYNTGEIISQLDKLHLLVLSAETGQRGYLLTENEQYLAPYQQALANLQQQIENIRTLESEIPQQPEKIDALLTLIGDKIEELITTVELAKKNKERTALKMVMSGRGRNLYNEIKEHFDALLSMEVTYRDQLFLQLLNIEKSATMIFSVSAATSLLLLIGIMRLAYSLISQERKTQEILRSQNEALKLNVEEKTKELAAYADELEQSNRELESFAFVASHDLQEPLRKIRAFGDRLATNYADKLDERGADFIQRMQKAATRMSNLITDLLEYSRVSSRGKPFKQVELEQVITAVLDDLEIPIEETNATINFAQLPVIEADESQMGQLFQNLISNALKFRKQDKPPVVNIQYSESQSSDGKIHIVTITDNGIGFAQEFADKIFTPFQRLHAKSAYAGTGIGLAVCRRIVERHGGTITATSTAGEGSTFTIELPENYQLANLYGTQTDEHNS